MVVLRASERNLPRPAVVSRLVDDEEYILANTHEKVLVDWPMSIRLGCAVLFFRKDRKAVLLYRRDNNPNIPFPNCLDILGGGVESGETPEHAIVREMAEELYDLRRRAPYSLNDFRLFRKYTDDQNTEQHIFYREADFEIEDLRLQEGQNLIWCSEKELESKTLAFGFASAIREFFEHYPHR